MAVGTAVVSQASRVYPAVTAKHPLAALPNGSFVAIFDSDVDAVIAACRLLETQPDAPVWVASGESAADQITAARQRRSLLARLIGALGDEEFFVGRVRELAAAGKTIVATRGADAVSAPEAFAKTSHLIKLSTWTLQEAR